MDSPGICVGGAEIVCLSITEMRIWMLRVRYSKPTREIYICRSKTEDIASPVVNRREHVERLGGTTELVHG